MQARSFPQWCNGHLMISRSKQSGEENSGNITCLPNFSQKTIDGSTNACN